MSGLSTRARIPRRADLPPVPHRRSWRPVVVFLTLFAVSLVAGVIFFGDGRPDWTDFLWALLFAVIATVLGEYVRRRRGSRKTHRRKRAA